MAFNLKKSRITFDERKDEKVEKVSLDYFSCLEKLINNARTGHEQVSQTRDSQSRSSPLSHRPFPNRINPHCPPLRSSSRIRHPLPQPPTQPLRTPLQHPDPGDAESITPNIQMSEPPLHLSSSL